MKPEASAVAFHVLGIALALGDDLVLALELHSGFAKGFFVVYFAVAGLAAQLEIPVFGEVLGLTQAVFLGGNPPVLAGEVGGTLPATAIVASIDVDLAAENCVFLWHRAQAAETAKLCNTCASIPEGLMIFPSL